MQSQNKEKYIQLYIVSVRGKFDEEEAFVPVGVFDDLEKVEERGEEVYKETKSVYITPLILNQKSGSITYEL